MKRNKKTRSILLAALVGAMVFAMVGCGGKKGKDWSEAAFTDYDPEVFMTKTDVEYSLGSYDITESADQYAAWAPTHLMLYKDGSVAGVTGFDQKAAFKMFEAGCGVKVYDDNCVTGVFYGSWSKDGDTVSIKVNGLRLASYYKDGEPIEGVKLEDVLIDFEYEAEIEDDVLTVIDFKTLGSNEDLVSYPIQSTNVMESLKAFTDSIPEGDLNMGGEN